MTTRAKAFNDRFKLIYENIKKFHLTGKPGGLEVANKYSNEIDKLISSELDLDYKSKGIVVLGLGGYGRRELSRTLKKRPLALKGSGGDFFRVSHLSASSSNPGWRLSL